MGRFDARLEAERLIERAKQPLWRWLDWRVLAGVVTSSMTLLGLLFATASKSQQDDIRAMLLAEKIVVVALIVGGLYLLCCAVLFAGRLLKELFTRFRVAPALAVALLRAGETYSRAMAAEAMDERRRALEGEIQRNATLQYLRQIALHGKRPEDTEESSE